MSILILIFNSLNAIVPNNARQRKDNYRFVVDNSSEANPIDWYNAYLEVDFQLVTLADFWSGNCSRAKQW